MICEKDGPECEGQVTTNSWVSRIIILLYNKIADEVEHIKVDHGLIFQGKRFTGQMKRNRW